MPFDYQPLVLEQIGVHERVRGNLGLGNEVLLVLCQNLLNNVRVICRMLLQSQKVTLAHRMNLDSVLCCRDILDRHVRIEHPRIDALDTRDVFWRKLWDTHNLLVAHLVKRQLLPPNLLQLARVDWTFQDTRTKNGHVVHSKLALAHVVRGFKLILNNIFHLLDSNRRIDVSVNLRHFVWQQTPVLFASTKLRANQLRYSGLYLGLDDVQPNLLTPPLRGAVRSRLRKHRTIDRRSQRAHVQIARERPLVFLLRTLAHTLAQGSLDLCCQLIHGLLLLCF